MNTSVEIAQELLEISLEAIELGDKRRNWTATARKASKALVEAGGSVVEVAGVAMAEGQTRRCSSITPAKVPQWQQDHVCDCGRMVKGNAFKIHTRHCEVYKSKRKGKKIA